MPQKAPQQQIGPFLQYLAEQLYPSVTSLAKGEPARPIPNLPASPGKVEGTDDPRLGAGAIEAVDLLSNFIPAKLGAVGAAGALKAARKGAGRAGAKNAETAAASPAGLLEPPPAANGDLSIVNIGMDIPGGGKLTEKRILGALKKAGVDVVDRAIHRSNTENTVVATLSRPLSKEEADGLSRTLKQDAIVQFHNGAGELYGPKAADWGPFNPEYFLTLDGKRMSDVTAPAAPAAPAAASAAATATAPGGLLGAEGQPGLVSTRFPTAKKATENPLQQYLQPNMEAVRADPEMHAGMMRILATYPGMPKNLASAPPDEIEATVRNFMADNLRAIHDAVPANVRQHTKRWYDGANKIATERGEKFGVPTTSSAATYAALSPQMPWHMNVALGDRTLDTITNQASKKFDDRMLAKAEEIFGPEMRPAVERLKGKRLSDLEDTADKAVFTRLYDETYNPSEYRYVTPEGGFGDIVRTKEGKPGKVSWGTYGQIENAIKAIEARGDVDKISSDVLGNRHKVRSFYNNILYPNAPQGDVTSDTHHVAASLFRPLGGSAIEVSHALGSSGAKGSVNMPKSSLSGIQGSYPIYADAARDVARQLGISPREVQSITWEGIRGLFTPEFKRSKGADQIVDIWNNLGVKNAAEARDQVVSAAGGYRLPDWWASP